MVELRENFFVVTGASGSGKSAIVAALKRRGFECVDEIGRQVVQEQVRIGSDVTPWQDHPRFMELVLGRSMQAFSNMAERISPVFFDRGIAECLGYARLLKVGVQEHHLQAASNYRYNRTVFVTPPWKDIYTTDSERRHNFEAGVEAHHAVAAAYVESGYDLLEVPRATVEARVEFILMHVRELAD